MYDLHNDYPLALEKLEITQDIANEYGIKVVGVNKLFSTLKNKSKYEVHYRNLQLHLSLGIKLIKNHRILKFKQSNWLEKHINFNTVRRKNTDSLVYEIKGEDVYEDVYSDKDLFDFSEYPVDSKFFETTNKNVIGKIKDEFKGEVISAFVGLKSKMYSIIIVKNEEITKGKGVNKKIRPKEFVDVLFNRKVTRHSMKRIQIKLHKIESYDVYKISLSCFDEKRYVLDDGVNTLAYFHEDTKD